MAFNKECHSFRLGLRPVSDPIRRAIYEEGHKWKLTDSQINDLLIKVQSEIDLAYAPIEGSITHINVKDLNSGEQLRLHGADEVDGPAELCLLYLGRCRFMVLSTSRRHALMAEDVVEVAKTEIISVNYPIQFKGCIERITKENILFKRIFVTGMYPDATFFDGKEDHVWMSRNGFEDYKVGDCVQFFAEVYR